uniref:Uncharacterized protein n=1 Tax=Molossus molossus TaxID=27622 RepID=A0A7J8F993_MOLMO|nr:hypothetical protein HJG59_008563 [Molossus molossus]
MPTCSILGLHVLNSTSCTMIKSVPHAPGRVGSAVRAWARGPMSSGLDSSQAHVPLLPCGQGPARGNLSMYPSHEDVSLSLPPTLKKVCLLPSRCDSGLSFVLCTKRSLVQFQVRVQAWVTGSIPSRGHDF